ncbi:MAG: hypothetical protein KUG82_23215 [Pseudomonadales bacterium]|nr:hypothetical protein [Pseudomonadales bacterium]
MSKSVIEATIYPLLRIDDCIDDSRLQNLIKQWLKGRTMLIRYVDDFVVAFQYRHEARMFY